MSAARLITLPLFSGLGAIGGLLLVAYLPFAAPVFAPSPSTPLAISTEPNLPPYTVGQPYPDTALVATGGMGPYRWEITESTKGAVPAGLNLNEAGVLSGTPSKPGQGNRFVVEVTDSAGTKLLKEFFLQESKGPDSSSGKKSGQEPGETAGTGAKPDANTPPNQGGGSGESTTTGAGPKPDPNAAQNKGGDSARTAAAGTGPKPDANTPHNKGGGSGESTRSGSGPRDDAGAPRSRGDGDAKAVATGEAPQTPPKLEDIFDLQKNLIGLFVAAVFGLTPGLLFNRLQQQAERYKADLKSSQSTEGTQRS